MLNWYKIAKYGDQMRKLWLSQGYTDTIIDSYLDTFSEFRKVKVAELFHDIPKVNIPKEKRIDITAYMDFKELENVVDYVRGRRLPKQENIGSSSIAPIYENDGIAIYRGNNAQECIGIKGSDNASWCVAAKSGNMYGAYRYKENEPTFYFVKDKGENKTKYNFFVIQVTKDGGYIVTSHANDGDQNFSWGEIIEIQPKLNNLQGVFKNIPIPKEEKEKYDYYNNKMTDADFAKLSYSDKKQCLDMAGHEIMNDAIFMELPDDLKNYYIGFGIGLTKPQFGMIKDNAAIAKRYKEVTDRKTIDLINQGAYLYQLTPTDIEILDIDNNKAVQDALLNNFRKSVGDPSHDGIPSSPNYFVTRWVKQEVDREWKNGSGEWIKAMAESIKADSDTSYELTKDKLMINTMLSGNQQNYLNIPKDILDAITEYIVSRGYPPYYLKNWCAWILESGKAPQEWIDGILKYADQEGHVPTFAHEWFYKIYKKMRIVDGIPIKKNDKEESYPTIYQYKEPIEITEPIEASLNWYERITVSKTK